jgi:hypothetical protein
MSDLSMYVAELDNHSSEIENLFVLALHLGMFSYVGIHIGIHIRQDVPRPHGFDQTNYWGQAARHGRAICIPT